MTQQGDIWIFGYGSLMWAPGFPFERTEMATLSGYHRDLCILSYVFRGTPEVPGLVMGLNPGGKCLGKAFLVSAEHVAQTMAYLDEREMINKVYEPSWVEIELADGARVIAYTFVAVQDHEQHVGHFLMEEKVRYVLQGIGQGGSALEYLENCCSHLRSLSIHDETLEAILSACLQESTRKG